jgi:hypothetical protein
MLAKDEAAYSCEQAYEHAHSNFSGMVLGATKNSYVQRGAVWEVMSNKTGGISSSGGLQHLRWKRLNTLVTFSLRNCQHNVWHVTMTLVTKHLLCLGMMHHALSVGDGRMKHEVLRILCLQARQSSSSCRA